MSFANIGKLVNAGSDFTKLSKTLKGFETSAMAANALNKYSKASKEVKIGTLVNAFHDLDGLDSNGANKLLDIADGVTDIGDAALKSSGNMKKLKEGISGAVASAKTFISTHGVAFGIGAAATVATIAYTAYKAYKQNMINTATEATSAWNKSLSDVQSKIQQYQELKTKLSSGDLSESETISVKQEILDLQNQIVSSYGDQAAGIDLVNGKLDDQLQKLKDISQEELYNNAKDSLNENQKAYKDAEKEMTKSDRSYVLGSTLDNTGFERSMSKHKKENQKASKDILEIAKKFKDQGIDIFHDEMNYTFDLAFTGDATQADKVINDFESEVRELQDKYGDDNEIINKFLSGSSSALEKNNKILDKYQDNYKSYLEQQLYFDDNGNNAHLLNDYSEAVNNLNDALTGQDSDKIHEAESAYINAKKAKDDFLSDTGNEKYSTLFDDVEDQLNSVTKKAFDFKEAMEGKASDSNQFKKQSKDIQKYSENLKKAKLDIVDVQEALEQDGFQKGEYYVQKLAEAFGLTSENMDEESIKAFANVLADIGVVAGSTGSSVSSLSNQIEELLSRTSLLSEVSDLSSNPVFDSIAKADESKNAGDDYVKGYQYLKEAKEMYDKGLIGTDDFKTRAAYFSPTESNDPANFIENYKKAKRYFTDGSSGVENFLTDLKNKGYATFETLSDGTKKWSYDIDDLQDAAQNMGVGFEAFMDMFGRLEDYGFHNNFVASVEDGADRITDLSTQLVKEQAKLAEMETTGQYTTTDSDGKTHKTMANQTAIDAQREKVQALKNDIQETQKAMDQLTQKNADDYDKQVESAKQAISTLKEERDKIKSDNTYGDNTDSVVELMDAQIKQWAEDNHITLDADLNIVEDSEQLEDEIEPLKLDVDYSDLSGLQKQAENSISSVQSLINETSKSKITLDLDNGNLRNIDTQIETVKNALSTLKGANGEIDISTPGASEAISVLSALYAQRQNLTGEVIMSIDTSKLDGDVQTVISKLQEFHQAYTELQNLNTLKEAGVTVDTTDAENKLSSLTSQLQSLDGDQAEIFAKIVPDPSSTQSIESSIGQVKVDALINDIGIPDDAVQVKATVKGQNEVNTLESSINGLQDKNVKVTAKVYRGELSSLVGQLAALKDKNINVTTTYTTIGSPSVTGSPYAAPVTLSSGKSKSEKPKASGTFTVAHATGTAYNVQNYRRLTPAHADGNVGLRKSENALVNEEYFNGHSESIVRDGVWSLIPGGAHIQSLKRGDIIFSAKQTDDLLRSGATPGHARAYANGTLSMNSYAGGSGGGSFGIGGSGKKRKSSSSSSSKNKSTTATNSNTTATNSNTKATEDNTEAQENLQDWISRLTDNMKDWNDSFKNAIDQFEMHYNQNRAIDEYVNNSESYKQNLRTAANTYMSKANALGLSGAYVHKIWKGEMNIEDIQDETLRDKIEKYTEWYDKARDLNSEIAEINKSIKETKIQKLDNIKDDYDNLVSLSTSVKDYNDSISDLSEKLNGVGDANALLSSMNAQVAIRQALVNSEAQLNAQLNALVADGTIGMYTDTWNKWQEEINGVKKSIIEADEALNELKQSIIEIRFSNFTKSIDNLDFTSDMSSSIQDLLSDEGIYDNNVKITSEGYTKLGLMGSDLIAAKQKVSNYNEAIRALKENYKQGNISQADFNEKLQEYQKDQMEAVSATKKARDAIIDLIKDGIEKETDAMDELISKRKEDLDKQKEYYDFQKKMNDQSKEMNKVRAQLAVLEGDDSLEATAKRRKLESQLKDLQETYDEDQKDHEKDVVSDAYDKTLEDFKKNQEDTIKELETSLEKQNQAISDALEAVKNNYGDVYDVLGKLSEQYNFTLTDDLVSPWTSAENALKHYQDAVTKLNPNVSVDDSKITPSNPSSSSTVPTHNESKYVTTKNQNGTWINQDGRWWYQHNDGSWTKDGWEKIDGSWYKFDREGWMQSGGWQPWGTDKNGKTAWYYLNDSGAMATGWKKDKNNWYYLDGSGMMQTGWVWDGKAWYYMNNSGAMVTSQWIGGKDGKQYYVTSSGAMATNGYVKSKNSNMYYWVNGQGVWEPQWNTTTPNLSKYKLYYSSGTPKAKDQLAFMDDKNGKLSLGSEAMITDKGILGNWGNNTIFSAEQTQALFDMSRGIMPDMTGMINNVKSPVPMNITNNVNQGDVNVHYDSLVTVQGDVNKDMFPGIKKMAQESFDYTVKELKKHYGRLK